MFKNKTNKLIIISTLALVCFSQVSFSSPNQDQEPPRRTCNIEALKRAFWRSLSGIINRSSSTHQQPQTPAQLAPRPQAPRPQNAHATMLSQAAQNGDTDNIRNLLDQGVDPDTASYSRPTALYVAIRSNQINTILLLLERGANIHAQSQGYQTPFDIICHHLSLDNLRILLNHRPDIATMRSPIALSLIDIITSILNGQSFPPNQHMIHNVWNSRFVDGQFVRERAEPQLAQEYRFRLERMRDMLHRTPFDNAVPFSRPLSDIVYDYLCAPQTTTVSR